MFDYFLVASLSLLVGFVIGMNWDKNKNIFKSYPTKSYENKRNRILAPDVRPVKMKKSSSQSNVIQFKREIK